MAFLGLDPSLFGGPVVEKPKRPAGIIRARQPRDAVDGKPSLNRLSPELITKIVDMVYSDSPDSMTSVSLVSSYYNRIGRYAQHREQSFKFSAKPEALEERISYIDDYELFPAIRRMKVCEDKRSSQTEDLILDLLLRAEGLTDLEWNVTCAPGASSGISAQIIAALAKKPSVRLHVHFALYMAPHGEGFEQRTQASMLRLENCANLHSLSVEHTYRNPSECIAISEAVRHLLISCPNIRKLALHVGKPKGGCVVYYPDPSYVGLGIVGSERLPALEELELCDYAFGDSGRNVANTGGNVILYPGQGNEMDHWASTFDWSRLRRLRTDQPAFLMCLREHLISLEEVSVDEPDRNAGILKEFYDHVPVALTKMNIHDISSVGLDTVLRHGPRLKCLTIHRNEGWKPPGQETSITAWAAAAPSLETMLRIRQQCPYIEELSLDVRRDGDWPFEALGVLAGFPRLRKLVVWFEIGSSPPNGIIRPLLNWTAAESLAQYIYAKRPQHLRPIKQIDIRSGCPAPLGFGYPGPTALWPHEKKLTFTCRLSVRDDEAGRGVYVVSCNELSKGENERMKMGIAGSKFEDVFLYGPSIQ